MPIISPVFSTLHRLNPGRASIGAGTSSGGPASWIANAVSYMPFDTDFTDTKGMTWTMNNRGYTDLVINTSVKKFGAGSLSSTQRTGAWMQTSSNAKFTWAGNFSVSMWLKAEAIYGNQLMYLFDNNGAGAARFGLALNTNAGQLTVYYNSTNANLSDSSGLNETTSWHFVNVQRVGDTITGYVDGVALPNTIDATGLTFSSGSTPVMANLSLESVWCYDDFMIVKGDVYPGTSVPTGALNP